MKERLMNSAPLKPCRHPGCSELVHGGFCEKHQRARQNALYGVGADRKKSGEWHHLYYRARWREMRAAQLIKEPFCSECARRGVRKYATDVDHIIPHRGDEKLFFDEKNLQSLCHSCHSKKTIAEQSSPGS